MKHQSHKKRKGSLETRATLLIFLLELEVFGVAVQAKNQSNEKMAASSEDFLSEDDIEAVLASFCCDD